MIFHLSLCGLFSRPRDNLSGKALAVRPGMACVVVRDTTSGKMSAFRS